MKPTLLISCLLAYICFGCNNQKPLFQKLDAGETGISFNNAIVENDSVNIVDFFYIYNGGGVGIGDLNNDGLPDIYFTGNQVSSKLYLNKGNLTFEDITEAAGVSTKQWARGVAMADINADGLMDMYISISGSNVSQQNKNLLFINQGTNNKGTPTFKEQAAEYGLADTAHATQAAFFDYDRDGDLDMYLLTNGIEKFNHNTLRPKKVNGEGISTDRLYRNEGHIDSLGHPVFRNVSREAGILIEGYGLGIAISDINRDGWPDIYCANDFITNDLLWINNGDGTFTDRASSYIKHTSYNGMGTDISDFNNDGLVDIVEVDMLPEGNQRQKTMLSSPNYDRYQHNLNLHYAPQYVRNTLQMNNGSLPDTADQKPVPMFSEIGQLSGIYATDWSWSALFADYDNDGYRDLFITNGYPKDIIDLDYITYQGSQRQFGTQESVHKKILDLSKGLPYIKIPNYLFHNNGSDTSQSGNGRLAFSDKSKEWGFDLPTDSNGAAFADLDNDGDLDLVVNNINEAAGIYQNNSRKKDQKGLKQDNHFLRIQLKGEKGNQQGLGAKITLRTQGKQQFYEHSTVRGFQSTVENTVHFGLGASAQIDSLQITWLDGRQQLLRHVKADQLLSLDYKDASAPTALPPAPKPLFREVAHLYGIDFKHQENDFIDFKIQPLLPHKYSQNGPGIAVGDVDGNGLDDFYVGGASGQSGAIYLQQPSASKKAFISRAIDPAPKPEEDMGSLLFDADSDGDLDLYVVSGGNEFAEGSASYLDRLYLNDGKGIFSRSPESLPDTKASGSCVVAIDFDHDGDLDLFVGGRIVPGKYPMPAQSYLLRNDSKKGGKPHFTDVTASIAKELSNIGLVTSALWTDFDNDGWSDLILAGEWMPLSFFKNQQGKLVNVTASTGLSHTSGWWNSLVAGDFDNDGDIDYVAGNLGLNSKYKASVAEPVCVYANDFDKNGSLDAIICYFLPGVDGKRYSFPAHPRDAISDQMVSMRKIFPRYADYALAKPQDFLPEKELKEAYVVQSENFSSSYIENLGKGQFRLKALPVEAQIAPLFGMVSQDYNGDGQLDLFTVGNSHATEIQMGQYDASIGLLLRGNGKGNFTPVKAGVSGFRVEGDAKGMAEITLSDGSALLLVSKNSGNTSAYQSTNQSKSSMTRLQPLEVYAEVTLANGKKRRQEFYYGSTYLSQSGRVWQYPTHATQIKVYNSRGKSRDIPLEVLSLQ